MGVVAGSRLSNPTLFLRILRHSAGLFRRSWHIFVLNFFLAAISVYFGFLPRLAQRDILNVLMPPINETLVYEVMSNAFLQIAIATIIFLVLGLLQNLTVNYLGEKAVYETRNMVFNAIMQKSFSFHDKTHVGDLVTRTTRDVDQIKEVMSNGINRIIVVFFQFLFSLFILGNINIELTIIVLAIMPVNFLFSRKYYRISRPLYRQLRETFGKVNTLIHQNIVGVIIVRIFNKGKQETRKLSDTQQKIVDLDVGGAKIRGKYGQNSWDLVHELVTAIIYLFTAVIIVRSFGTPLEFKWGDLSLFILTLQVFLLPIRMVGKMAGEYPLSAAAAKRVFDIIDLKSDVEEKKDAVPAPPLKGEVEFQNVTFGYDKNNPVLKNVSFKVEAEETIALVGAIGSGKTTIINLISRFYDVNEGKVLVDGYEVRDLKVESLRRQIGTAMQNIFLFSVSFKENISCGKPEATMDEVVDAAEKAQIHNFIISTPKGYNTLVGERGIDLSAGQRQRVTIARALLINPSILILDEPTSYLDAETEMKLHQAFKAVTKNRTTFIISHRLLTVKDADRIFVLKNGEIVETGSHKELLSNNGEYSSLYEAQLSLATQNNGKRGSAQT